MSDVEQEFRARAAAVMASRANNLRDILRAAGLDPERHARVGPWRNLSFANADLRGMDFTAARLTGCNFEGARIAGARFDRAILGTVGSAKSWWADLTMAGDWPDHCKGWKKNESDGRDHHLSVGDVFQDSPIAPKLVFLRPPPSSRVITSPSNDTARLPLSNALAVGLSTVTAAELAWFRKGAVGPVLLSWDEANDYVDWLSEVTARTYRLLSESEWEAAATLNALEAPDAANRNYEWCEDHFRSQLVGEIRDALPWPGDDPSIRVKRMIAVFGNGRDFRFGQGVDQGKARLRVAREVS
jgi:hypothetical protein